MVYIHYFLLSIFSLAHSFDVFRVFAVENETDNYRLRVEDYNNASTAGDSLYQVNRPHNKMQFSTKDRDNDQ